MAFTIWPASSLTIPSNPLNFLSFDDSGRYFPTLVGVFSLFLLLGMPHQPCFPSPAPGNPPHYLQDPPQTLSPTFTAP